MSDPPKTFGAAFRTYRLRAQLTQEQVAKAMEVDFTYVSKIEKQGKVPSRDKIEKAADAFRLTRQEGIDLLRLAETVPSDFERWVVRERPAAMDLYRSIQGTPPHQQEDLIRKLIEQVEAETNREPEES